MMPSGSTRRLYARRQSATLTAAAQTSNAVVVGRRRDHEPAERRTNAEIAASLFLSQKTVRNYVSGILAKLQVADRAEARLVARAAGIGAPPGQAPLETGSRY
jgi:hypothetical protein